MPWTRDLHETGASLNKFAVWMLALLAGAVIGWVDFYSGNELRIFPLYYGPISLIAWHLGRVSTLIASAASAHLWLAANLMAGMQFSHVGYWVANTFLQGLSFATVGFLITMLKSALTRERALSRTDPVTSMLNGRAFHEEATRILELCRRKNRPVTPVYIDLDNFKAVNDSVGHRAGDALLRDVAAAIRASTRLIDLCARLGGDEFVVLLPETGMHQAALPLERLRTKVLDAGASATCPVTSSIGAMTFVAVPDSLDEMISAADSLMYAAKAAGKNRLLHQSVGTNDG